jgi:hypothetical protein
MISRHLARFGDCVLSASIGKIQFGFKEGYEILATALGQGPHTGNPRHHPYY